MFPQDGDLSLKGVGELVLEGLFVISYTLCAYCVLCGWQYVWFEADGSKLQVHLIEKVLLLAKVSEKEFSNQ
jgi:hypothetical protein